MTLVTFFNLEHNHLEPTWIDSQTNWW